MPNYKKRPVKKVKAKKPSKSKSAPLREEIPMEDARTARQKKQKKAPQRAAKPQKTVQKAAKSQAPKKPRQSAPSNNLKVIFGGKNKKRSFLTAAVVGVLILAVLLFELLTPTGMIETIQNKYALLSASGSGLDGLQGERFLSLQTADDSIAVLSDKYFELYNEKGKTVLYDQHGFANPQMVHSAARTIVYESGGKGIKVYNRSTRLYDQTLENNLYTATVSRSGHVAVATQSVGYSARVEIFDKGMKSVFTKEFTEDLVSNIALSQDGRYISIAFLRASGGDFESMLSVYKVGSGAKVFEHTYVGTAVNRLQTLKKSQFLAAAQDKAAIIGFKDGAEKPIEMDRLAFLDTNLQGEAVLVHAYQGNAARHTVTVVDSRAQTMGAFTVDGNIKDIALGKASVSFLLDSQIKTYAFDGQEISTTECGFNSTLVAEMGQKLVAITGRQLVFYS